ncbi:hypothetical protein D3C78_1490630 [compost metagenome]
MAICLDDVAPSQVEAQQDVARQGLHALGGEPAAWRVEQPQGVVASIPIAPVALLLDQADRLDAVPLGWSVDQGEGQGADYPLDTGLEIVLGHD